MTVIQRLKWESRYTFIFVEFLIGRRLIALMFDWRDGWIGFYLDPQRRRMYWLPFPFVGLRQTVLEQP